MDLRLYFLTIFLFISSLSFAQYGSNFCNDVKDKHILNEYEKAVKLLMSDKINNAETILLKILEKQPTFVEAWLAMSDIHYSRYETAQTEKSRDDNLLKYTVCLKKVVEYCPDFPDLSIYLTLGKVFYLKDDFKSSREFLEKYLSKNSNNDKKNKEAQEILDNIKDYLALMENPVPFNPVVVKGVSTIDDEYLPIVSPDGSVIMYTRSYFKKDVSSIYTDKFVEEFTLARLNPEENDNSFYQVSTMPYPFNAGKNQGAASITIDNSVIYITICEFITSDYDNCDIYYSYRIGENTWSELKNLGTNINGISSWESQPSISSDGRTIYFSSIRDGNVGFNPDYPTSDIWCSHLQSDGSWSKAYNLGEPINTPGNEKTPFIHSDSQTLYFSSDGHIGLGGYDIFYSKFVESNWQKPTNIGYPINTKSNELGLIVSTDGQKAYFASNKLNGLGGWDIYSFDLYKEARPEKVLLVKGQLLDDEGSEVKNAFVEMKNTRTDVVSEGLVNSETGNYAVAVTIDDHEHQDDFLMVVKKEDYSFTSALISVTDNALDAPIVKDFELKPIEIGKSVELNDIYFATASFAIDNKSLKVLDSFVEFLDYNKTVEIELQGYTDNVGSVESNIVLSENRAKAVYDYLISKGIEASRLRYQGFGPNQPIADNNTDSGRAKNRRTEFYIISK